MAKFKVGDKVRVKSNLSVGDKYPYGVVSEMVVFAGKIVTIYFVGKCDVTHTDKYTIKEDDLGWSWSEEMFEDEPISDEFKTIKATIDKSGITVVEPKLTIGGDFSIQRDLYDSIFEIHKKEGEKEMRNEVLELWYERKELDIIIKYDELINKDYESLEIVKKYNELTDKYMNDLNELYECEDNKEGKYIVKNSRITLPVYPYEVDDCVYSNIVDEYEEDKKMDIAELDNLKAEIQALLSLSDNLEYQLDILVQYGIIDKKTKKMVD